MKEAYKASTDKVNENADVNGTNELAQRLVMGFDKNEVVQVSENYMD
jgi:Fe2+ transport system protein FeoA